MARAPNPDEATVKLAERLVLQQNVPFHAQREVAAAFWAGYRSLRWRDMHEAEQVDALARWLAANGHRGFEPRSAGG